MFDHFHVEQAKLSLKISNNKRFNTHKHLYLHVTYQTY